mmetsp:Transcript_14549/g.36557  ORF Transcript_14549/g.36557 Transcript_14549/m.36557 type:complete len:211 (-) Transcript_14549:38-670(-)
MALAAGHTAGGAPHSLVGEAGQALGLIERVAPLGEAISLVHQILHLVVVTALDLGLDGHVIFAASFGSSLALERNFDRSDGLPGVGTKDLGFLSSNLDLAALLTQPLFETVLVQFSSLQINAIGNLQHSHPGIGGNSYRIKGRIRHFVEILASVTSLVPVSTTGQSCVRSIWIALVVAVAVAVAVVVIAPSFNFVFTSLEDCESVGRHHL